MTARRDRDKALAAARRRALLKLVDLHPSEYVILVGAECAAMGIDAPGDRPNGRPPNGRILR